MSLKDIAKRVMEEATEKPQKKSKHTFYLIDAQYVEFLQSCTKYGKKPSDVIDQLIASYLEEVRALEGRAESKTT